MLDPVQRLNAGAHLLLDFLNFGGGRLPGFLYPGLLGGNQRVGILGILHGGSIGVAEHLGAFLLRFAHHLIAGFLGIDNGVLHGCLIFAVFFQLTHQNTHLALEQGIFLVQGDVVLNQWLQKFIDIVHVVAAEGLFAERYLLKLLRCKHSNLFLSR